MGFRPTDEELKDLLEEVKITNLPINQLSYWPFGQMANLPITLCQLTTWPIHQVTIWLISHFSKAIMILVTGWWRRLRWEMIVQFAQFAQITLRILSISMDKIEKQTLRNNCSICTICTKTKNAANTFNINGQNWRNFDHIKLYNELHTIVQSKSNRYNLTLHQVRLSLESSASCAQHSWWRTLIWRPCRRSWGTRSGSTTRRARGSSPWRLFEG